MKRDGQYIQLTEDVKLGFAATKLLPKGSRGTIVQDHDQMYIVHFAEHDLYFPVLADECAIIDKETNFG